MMIHLGDAEGSEELYKHWLPLTTRLIVIRGNNDFFSDLDPEKEIRIGKYRCLLTHGHYDHVGAVDTVAEETGALVYMNERDDARHAADERMPYTLKENGKSYDDGDVIEIAGLRFEVIATPGHTPGGVTLRCEDVLFTGDTLFKGSCGRTDLPGGDMMQELRSLRRICELPGDYEVYPGHMDPSTLEREREFNYYCRAAIRN